MDIQTDIGLRHVITWNTQGWGAKKGKLLISKIRSYRPILIFLQDIGCPDESEEWQNFTMTLDGLGYRTYAEECSIGEKKGFYVATIISNELGETNEEAGLCHYASHTAGHILNKEIGFTNIVLRRPLFVKFQYPNANNEMVEVETYNYYVLRHINNEYLSELEVLDLLKFIRTQKNITGIYRKLIIMGDFNTNQLGLSEEEQQEEYNIIGFKLDYIITKGLTIEDSTVSDSCSDHKMLIAQLNFSI